MTAPTVALACERDPEQPVELEEIEKALRMLLEDGLAEGLASPSKAGHATKASTTPNAGVSAQPLYRPTRAAIRASELSF
ncbi:MAG TPA: hypothetical protein VIJ50_01975 [Solirubrobacteraceae bacterium]